MNIIDSFVYCWNDTLNNKIYIGSHKGSEHDGYICSSKIVLEEYKKRPSNFVRTIIAKGIYKDIRNLEHLLLKKLNAAKNKDFYNQHNGDGEFYCKGHTDETKKKIAENGKGKTANFGKENGMYGKKHTDETKKKIAEKAGHWQGKKHSEETKNKMSISMKGLKHKPFYGRPMKIETKEKIIKANLGRKMSQQTKQKMSESRKAFLKRKEEGVLNG
jgi:hypothetical protein